MLIRPCFKRAVERTPCKGMGTTVVAARFSERSMSAVHVGDSRLYLLRGERLSQLTSNHTLRQSVINVGYYTPEDAVEKLSSDILDRAVGGEEDLALEQQSHGFDPGDLYLFCSDRLSDLVDSNDPNTLLSGEYDDFPEMATTLINCANTGSGKDNVSIVLVCIASHPDASLPFEERA